MGGNTTRVLASDLDQLSSYLKTNFGYDTGPYQGYPFETPAKRYLGKLDYNLNDRNKISVRYTPARLRRRRCCSRTRARSASATAAATPPG